MWFISCVHWIWYKLHKSTFIGCTRWLAWTKNRLNHICDRWTMNKCVRNYILLFVHFFKLTNQFLFVTQWNVLLIYHKCLRKELRITFGTIFKNLLINLFLSSSNGMYFLCTLDLIISYTNQSLLLVLGGWLKQKWVKSYLRSKWGTMNKWVRNCILVFVHFF